MYNDSRPKHFLTQFSQSLLHKPSTKHQRMVRILRLDESKELQTKVTLLDLLGEEGITQDPRFTLSTNPSAPKKIEEAKRSRRKITEQLLSGTDIMELANEGSESIEFDKQANNLFGITSSMTDNKPQAKPKFDLMQLGDYSSNQSEIKQPKLRRSIIMRTEKEKNTQLKNYMQNRLESLKVILNILKEKSERVIKKREMLEDLINKNTEHSMLNITQTVHDEISTLKLMVCKNPAYLEIVSSYVFANKRFGWRIPIDRPFMHIPYLDIMLVPYPLLLRVEIVIESIKKIDMSSTLSVLSNDIP